MPIVEDVIVPEECQRDALALLKADGAPFVYVRNWQELQGIFDQHSLMTDEERAARSKTVRDWYASFTQRMGRRFCDVVQRSFRWR